MRSIGAFTLTLSMLLLAFPVLGVQAHAEVIKKKTKAISLKKQDRDLADRLAQLKTSQLFIDDLIEPRWHDVMKGLEEASAGKEKLCGVKLYGLQMKLSEIKFFLYSMRTPKPDPREAPTMPLLTAAISKHSESCEDSDDGSELANHKLIHFALEEVLTAIEPNSHELLAVRSELAARARMQDSNTGVAEKMKVTNRFLKEFLTGKESPDNSPARYINANDTDARASGAQ
jgi:hypothetical protein